MQCMRAYVLFGGVAHCSPSVACLAGKVPSSVSCVFCCTPDHIAFASWAF